MVSVQEGYNHEVETRLLKSIRWPENGYRLFEISAPAGSSRGGFFGTVREANCLFMPRSLFDEIGEPGGSLLNYDFFWRTVAAAGTVFTLLGEGHFHQVHGGAATSLPEGHCTSPRRKRWKEEYERLSRPLSDRPCYHPILAGHVPDECHNWLQLPAA
jgi:hypothetical protein